MVLVVILLVKLSVTVKDPEFESAVRGHGIMGEGVGI